MARRRPKVLVVDGNRDKALDLHRVLYSGSQQFDVLLASNADVAREIMRELSIDVVITDIDLPGANAVDLVCWAALEFPETVHIVQTDDDVDQIHERISGLGCLRLMRKPCAPAEVLKIVHEALDCILRMSGSFSALSAADLIQMLCLAQRTAALRITAGKDSGNVMVKDGVLLHASWGGLSGQEALCAILDAKDGVFRTTPLPENVPRTIHINWQQALMEAVQKLDERGNSARRSTGALPAIRADASMLEKITADEEGDDEPSIGHRTPNSFLLAGLDARQTPRTGGAASSLVDKGFAALRAGNVEEARQCWLAAKQLDPENRSLDLNLKKLETRVAR
jgi:DNA-binding response OmpR family regulator